MARSRAPTATAFRRRRLPAFLSSNAGNLTNPRHPGSNRVSRHTASISRVRTRGFPWRLIGPCLRLSPLEFRLLDYLAHQADCAVSAGELANHLYGADTSGDANAIEALVARLRRKFGSDLIQTRRGFGYTVAS